jgi:branched-subunit amino acid aminotransferase/4-amino-4-deoxychorismate lyase
MIKTAVLNAQGLKSTAYHAESLADALQYEPEGIYTVTRSYHGHYALLLDGHLERLEESARLENIPLALDRATLRAALRDLLPAQEDSRFRITIPRERPDEIVFAVEPLPGVSAAILENGAHVMTITAQRQNPVAKSTGWMHTRKQATRDIPPNIYETLLLGADGAILEGSGSNFYAILNGELRTAEENVLKGIARKALLASAEGLLPIRLTPVTLHDLPHLEEAFLTSSSRGVVPITEINGESIGVGKPGPLTREIARRFDAWTDAHLEPI